jgi:hypothetical protein
MTIIKSSTANRENIMTTFTAQLNFSTKKENESAIKVKKWNDVNHYDTLCLYCANNNISIEHISDREFDGAAELMSVHGQNDKTSDYYFFWIC